MTLKELLELGIREDIIIEEEDGSFSAKINFMFLEEELNDPKNIGEKAEKFLMFRTSEAGGSVGCVVVWKSEEAMKLTNP